ncbi:MAG: UPF0280 family protein [Syntrophorhabdaceae bacterium]|nr:UPF0280 family protein [Syntrophorhabdaceae bacterium]
MYEERFYRSISRPDDLVCFEVKYKETDLFCCTKADIRGQIEDRVIFYRHQLEEYIRQRPEFLDSLIPIENDRFAPDIVKKMIEASTLIGVGPMACVAGAIAEFLGRDIELLSDEFIIENGGDIFLKTKRHRTILIYAKDSPFSEKIGIRIAPETTPYGVCTSSGTVGHSLSFGHADAVCVVGESSLFCDGLATFIGNIVKKEKDIPFAIEKAKTFKEIKGILIVMGDKLGIWGDIKLVRP